MGRLLHDLENTSTERFEGGAALASVARGDAHAADRFVHLLKHGTPEQITRTLGVLSFLGPDLAGRTAECIEQLVRIAGATPDAVMIIPALASVGRDDRRALHIVLTEARSRPPVMKRMKDAPNFEYDEIMYRRGPALSALEYFKAFIPEITPALIDALDSFEEYDPDVSRDGGNYGRVVAVLDRLGPDAIIPAIPTLLRKFRKTAGDVDWDIVRLFARVGRAAEPALPALLELQNEFPEDDSDGPPDELTNPLAWAIARIRGEL
jgi:hypothetical protein